VGSAGEIGSEGYSRTGDTAVVAVRLHLFGDSKAFEQIMTPGLSGEGSLALAVHRPGLVDWAWRGEYEPGQVHAVTLERGVSARGVVVGERGRPCGGLPLLTLARRGSTAWELVVPWIEEPIAITSDDGSFEVHGLPPGARLTVVRPGPGGFATVGGPSHVLAVVQVPVGLGEEVIDIGQVHLAGRRAVRGSIQGWKASFRGGEVVLTDSDGVGAVARPDDSGVFEFTDIPDGVYSLSVSFDGEEHGKLEVVLVRPEMGEIVVPVMSR
jgi:hypothetical protein